MGKIYVIHDPKVTSDIMPFLSDTNGSAASYFYNYCVVLKRSDLILYQIGDISYNEKMNGSFYFVEDIRAEICRMPEEIDDENLQ